MTLLSLMLSTTQESNRYYFVFGMAQTGLELLTFRTPIGCSTTDQQMWFCHVWGHVLHLYTIWIKVVTVTNSKSPTRDETTSMIQDNYFNFHFQSTLPTVKTLKVKLPDLICNYTAEWRKVVVSNLTCQAHHNTWLYWIICCMWPSTIVIYSDTIY